MYALLIMTTASATPSALEGGLAPFRAPVPLFVTGSATGRGTHQADPGAEVAGEEPDEASEADREDRAPDPAPAAPDPVAPAPSVAPALSEAPALSDGAQHRSRALLAGSVGSAAISAGLLVAASIVRSDYLSAEQGTEAQFRLNHGLGYSGFGAAGVSGALFVASLRMGEW